MKRTSGATHPSTSSSSMIRTTVSSEGSTTQSFLISVAYLELRYPEPLPTSDARFVCFAHPQTEIRP